MTKWGIFELDDTTVHVVPCDYKGAIKENHTPDIQCFCKPRIIHEDARVVISHNDTIKLTK